MFKFYIIILLFCYLISDFSESKEEQSKKLHKNSSQKKVEKTKENVEGLLKQIDSARKQLKSQELRLQDIQNKIIKRRIKNPQ